MIREPQQIGHILKFDRLDSFHSLNCVFSLGWRFTDDGADPWTWRMNRFKYDDEKAIRGACLVLPTALAELKFPDAPVVVASAIPSACVSLPTSHPLARLGSSVAGMVGGSWMPNLLAKEEHTRLHNIERGWDRDSEVRGKYRASRLEASPLILLVDDFVTRGSTLSDAARAILSMNSGLTVVGVVLGKTERRGYASLEGIQLDNSHIPQEWATMWDNA